MPRVNACVVKCQNGLPLMSSWKIKCVCSAFFIAGGLRFTLFREHNILHDDVDYEESQTD